MYLIFDTETTGLPKNYNAPFSDTDNWPRMVQIAWQLHDSLGSLLEAKNYIVKPEGYTIPYNAEQIHGISTSMAQEKGESLAFVLEELNTVLKQTKFLAGHNIIFDINIVGAEFFRKSIATGLTTTAYIDTKDESTNYCAIPGGKGGKFKWPTLTELHKKLFNKGFDEAHNAAADVEATSRCFLELIRLEVITSKKAGLNNEQFAEFKKLNKGSFENIDVNIKSIDPAITESLFDDFNLQDNSVKSNIDTFDFSKFVHLHNHSQYSILQSTAQVTDLVDKAKILGMKSVAVTDNGNMYGAFEFVTYAISKGIKPIVGCEVNICTDHTNKSQKDNGFQQVLIAKNREGYHNLAKLSSIGYINGFYYVPRIDKETLLQYKNNLIATTGGLFGEIPHLILNVGETQAEKSFLWWKENFGNDFYVELNRHNLPEESFVNEILIKFARKYDVKIIAANNVYYINKDDAKSHDMLLCVRDAELQATPKRYIGKRSREERYGLPNDEFYFKTQAEMAALFNDLPEVFFNINELVEKIEEYSLKREVLLPSFKIPDEFIDAQDVQDGGKRGENNYLRFLTLKGAEKKYKSITDVITERIDFELKTIANSGYPGYFLIVQDFTSQARLMGVAVGPGRGSAAGSIVAYCIGITNVDPIKYDLLFERFLNPDRVSLPDIDIDFDDEGRDKIIDWVVKKYGANQVAQIITYGTMAAKSSIRDAARVLNLPLADADRLSKMIPNIDLKDVFHTEISKLKGKLQADQIDKVNELRKIAAGSDLQALTLQQAQKLEGSIRNIGIHACGVIITPDDITKYIPMATAKDAELLVTQFDNSVVESAGLLKMDFLGLKTLTIIKDAIKLIKERHNVDIDLDTIPLDDLKTYQLYQRGETNGTFQFESVGMQKYLKQLKPDKFEDLIAMNALYRPGPIEYIPKFISRKLGNEAISYDLPVMEEYLKDTYGITVYQEQVMLLSQSLANFTKGEADVLRKAMGKKQREVLDKMKPKFIEGCLKNGHDATISEKVWKDWEAFAEYAFNKSHSTCYSLVAFHTGYLKANYAPEYMASVLTHNMSDIKKISFFMEECKRMGAPVLGPDINESSKNFTVNSNNQVRFGMAAIKGVGEAAVESIILERTKNGAYKSLYNLVERIDLRNANKRCFENLALAGAFDSFEVMHRAQYFEQDENGNTFIEQLLKYGNAVQQYKNAPPDLFGDSSSVEVKQPQPKETVKWNTLHQLNKEKEVVGIYISAHPLDDFRLEIDNFTKGNLSMLKNLAEQNGKDFALAGIISNAEHKTSQKGTGYGIFELEDYQDTQRFFLFSEDYLKFKHFMVFGQYIFVKGTVQKRSRRPEETEFEFKIKSIEQLSSVRENYARTITIEIGLKDLTDNFIENMNEIFSKSKGKTKPIFRITDAEEKIKIDLPSKTIGIFPTDEIMEKLKKMDMVKFQLN
jgi:DNA polymerase III subunit alpha